MAGKATWVSANDVCYISQYQCGTNIHDCHQAVQQGPMLHLLGCLPSCRFCMLALGGALIAAALFVLVSPEVQ
jgi:hypothetical protein